MILSPALTALTQDALRNALSLDNVLVQNQNPAVELRPERPHLGPVQLSWGAYAGAEFNDNINASQFNREADVLARAGVSLGFFWPATERSAVQFGTGLGYLHYSKYPQNSGLEVSPNSALTWQIGFTDGSVSLYDQFSYVQQVAQEASVANVTVLPRLDNTIGARVDWEPGHELLQAGYGHDTFFSPDSAYQFLNRSSEYFFGRAAWRFAENTQAGVESSATLASYELPIQSDYWNVSAGLYADWKLTQNLHLSCRAGPILYHFTSVGKAGPEPDVQSYYAELDLNQSLTQFLSHQLSLVRDVSPGLSIGSDYVEQFTASYSVTLALTQHLNVGGNVAYAHGNQPLLVPYAPVPGLLITETEYFDRYGFGLSISCSISDHFSASVLYNFWERHSSVAGLSYVQNVIGAQVNYNF